MIDSTLIGHNGHKYQVVSSWGFLSPAQYPVKDCHEMVMDSNHRLFMLTNHAANNILIYNKDGSLSGAWGTRYPGAHGLTISNENGTEFLFIADYERRQVIKTTLTGQEVMILDYPKETGQYSGPEEYKPTETAIGLNGDIYVTDGYGLQYVIQYNHRGEYIRHWGGRGDGNDHFDCVHGVAFDNRDPSNPSLIITSRNENAWKRFTLDGLYLDTIHLPGSFVCRPVIYNDNIYGAVFRSGTNQNTASGYITILDKNNRVISTPGGTAPEYIDEKLQEQKQEINLFIHPHDVCIDDEENLYVPQWNANGTYPIKLKRIK